MRAVFCFRVWIWAIVFLTAGGLGVLASAQSTQTLRIATYNLAADIDGFTTARPGADEVLEGIGAQNYAGIERPLDIVALEETTSNDITVAPVVSDLNSFYNGSAVYAQSTVQGAQNGSNAFGNGPNAIVYNTKTLQLISSVGVGTPLGAGNGEYRQVMRYQFQPAGGSAANSFYVYVTHMKSSFSGSLFTNESLRNKEAQIIRNDSATLVTAANPTPSILYMGDFNLSGTAQISNDANTASVSAYQTMTAAGPAYAVDPLNTNPQDNTISWNGNPQYQSIMTEEAEFLNYRDDLQLMTQNVFDGLTPGGLHYISGSLHPFGNNGSIGVGGAVFDPDNTALDDIDPNAPFDKFDLEIDLANASDHYPVVADYTIAVPEPSTFVLLAVGSMLLAFRCRFQQRTS